MGHWIADFFASPPSLFIAAVGVLVVSPIHVLIHELGHAAAALRLTRGQVAVRVGTGSARLSFDLGRLTVMAGRRQLGRPGGFCLYNLVDATSRTRGIIAACGPIASMIVGALSAVVWAHSGGLMRDLCWWLTFAGLGEGVVNALPWVLRDLAGNPHRSDGRLVLDAVRGLDQLAVDQYRRTRERATGSTPPPGY